MEGFSWLSWSFFKLTDKPVVNKSRLVMRKVHRPLYDEAYTESQIVDALTKLATGEINSLTFLDVKLTLKQYTYVKVLAAIELGLQNNQTLRQISEVLGCSKPDLLTKYLRHRNMTFYKLKIMINACKLKMKEDQEFEMDISKITPVENYFWSDTCSIRTGVKSENGLNGIKPAIENSDDDWGHFVDFEKENLMVTSV